MKKLLLLKFLISSYIHSMEEHKICHLARLPTTVRDLIAEYLVFKDRESNAEFIERTKIYKMLPRPLFLQEKFHSAE